MDNGHCEVGQVRQIVRQDALEDFELELLVLMDREVPETNQERQRRA